MLSYIKWFLSVILIIGLIGCIEQLYIMSKKEQRSKYIYTIRPLLLDKIFRKKYFPLREIHLYFFALPKFQKDFIRDFHRFIKSIDVSFNYYTKTHNKLYKSILKESKKKNPKIKIIYFKSRKAWLLKRINYILAYKRFNSISFLALWNDDDFKMSNRIIFKFNSK